MDLSSFQEKRFYLNWDLKSFGRNSSQPEVLKLKMWKKINIKDDVKGDEIDST